MCKYVTILDDSTISIHLPALNLSGNYLWMYTIILSIILSRQTYCFWINRCRCRMDYNKYHLCIQLYYLLECLSNMNHQVVLVSLDLEQFHDWICQWRVNHLICTSCLNHEADLSILTSILLCWVDLHTPIHQIMFFFAR